MDRECLEYSAQSEQVSIRLCLCTDFLKPIGYEMENGTRHIILLGGRKYDFKGEVFVRSLEKEGLRAKYLLNRIEHSLVSVVGAEETSRIVLNSEEKRVNIDSLILGEESYDFAITNCMIATDSYDGISNSLKYCISIDVVGSDKPCRLEVAFKVRNPMPLPPISMGLTSVFDLFDLFRFRIHLDRCIFTVNDIVTGWIEIVKADRRMNAMFVDLIRKEEHLVDDANGRREVKFSSDRLLHFEIMESIMKIDDMEDKKQPLKKDIEFSASYQEEAIESAVRRVPFRLFINERMGVCPSYTLLGNQLNVDWQLRFVIQDENLKEYGKSTDIDIVRGDILVFDV